MKIEKEAGILQKLRRQVAAHTINDENKRNKTQLIESLKRIKSLQRNV